MYHVFYAINFLMKIWLKIVKIIFQKCISQFRILLVVNNRIASSFFFSLQFYFFRLMYLNTILMFYHIYIYVFFSVKGNHTNIFTYTEQVVFYLLSKPIMVYSTLETDKFLQSSQFSSNKLLIDENLQKSQSNKKIQNKTN